MNTKNYPVFSDTAYAKLTTLTNTSITDITDVDNNRDIQINEIAVINLDATARTLTIRLHNGTNNAVIAVVQLAANAGNSTSVVALSLATNIYTAHLFRVLNNVGSKTLLIPKGWKLQASVDTTTNGVNIYVVGSKFVQVV